MNSNEFFLKALERADLTFKNALSDLNTEELRQQPAGANSNPVGWLAWHLVNVRDNYIARITESETVWLAQKWYEKFGASERPPTYKPETVGAFDPIDRDVLMGYFDAVNSAMADCIKDLKEADWLRMIPHPNPARPPQAVVDALVILASDNVQHIGQIAYLKGMIKGQGWYGV